MQDLSNLMIYVIYIHYIHVAAKHCMRALILEVTTDRCMRLCVFTCMFVRVLFLLE